MLIGEPLKADRSQQCKISCMLQQGDNSWPLIREVRKDPTIYGTSLPHDITAGSYELLLSGLGADYVSEIRLPLQVHAPNRAIGAVLHTPETKPSGKRLREQPAPEAPRKKAARVQQVATVPASTVQGRVDTELESLWQLETAVQDPAVASVAPPPAATAQGVAQGVDLLATSWLSNGISAHNCTMAVDSVHEQHTLSITERRCEMSLEPIRQAPNCAPTDDTQLPRSASLDLLDLVSHQACDGDLSLFRDASLKSVESATAFVESIDQLGRPWSMTSQDPLALERLGSNESIGWAAMLA